MLDSAHAPSKPVVDILAEGRRLRKELWQRRLCAARERHEAVIAELRIAIEFNALLPSRDAWQDILEIRFRESDALSEYIGVLRSFIELEAEVIS